MALADLESLYAAAVSALESGSYDTAITKALALKARLATTPNIGRSLGSGSQSLAWANAVALDSFIAECRKLKVQANAATYGMQRTKITYARPDCE